MSKVLVVGHGYVGQAYASLFERKHEVFIHDPYKNRVVDMEVQAQCQLAVICVPTPMREDGRCDTSVVEQVIRELPHGMDVMIKSTVEPGTTNRLSEIYGMARPLIFSPEYIGEGGYWVPPQFPHPTDPLSHGFVILGESKNASKECATRIIDMMMPIVGPATRFRIMSATEAELVKYFENAYLAMKVMFSNEMREICENLAVRYHTVREGWLDDPRNGPSHSAAFAKRGFDGKCLPKDTAALLHFCRGNDIDVPLLEAIVNANPARLIPRKE